MRDGRPSVLVGDRQCTGSSMPWSSSELWRTCARGLGLGCSLALRRGRELGSSPRGVLDGGDHRMMVCSGKSSAQIFGDGSRMFQATESVRSNTNGYTSSSSCAALARSKTGHDVLARRRWWSGARVCFSF
jgi:hypothetical protein